MDKSVLLAVLEAAFDATVHLDRAPSDELLGLRDDMNGIEDGSIPSSQYAQILALTLSNLRVPNSR